MGGYLRAGESAERTQEVRVDEEAVDLKDGILKGEEPNKDRRGRDRSQRRVRDEIS